MGKNKLKFKNKEALEFILVNRGMDDPNYQKPDAPSKVLLHVPKEEGEVTQSHQKILDQIPEISRGVYTSKVLNNQLREMGINVMDDPEVIKEKLDQMNKEEFIKRVNIDLTKNEVVQFEKNSRLKTSNTNQEEIVDTSFNPLINGKETVTITNELDDRKIDELLRRAKISANITEYNRFGLRKDIDPEVLNYITTKEFVEGVDIFIPAPEGTPIWGNRFDIDIPVEKMTEDYREVYEAMNIEDEGGEKDPELELEDDFVLLANEGVLPIEMLTEEQQIKKSQDEIVILETGNKTKNPSYKFITKEEKEFLDRQFNKTMKEYDIVDVPSVHKPKGGFMPKEIMEDAVNELIGAKKGKTKNNYMGLTAKYEDEEEYEDYEIDEEGEFDELEAEEESEDEEANKSSNNNKIQFCENNFKIEYEGNEDKKQNKKGKKEVKSTGAFETFTIEDMDELLGESNFVAKTMELCLNNPEDPNAEFEGIPVYYPKKRLDITAVHGKIGHLPKTIGIPNVRFTRGKENTQNESKIQRDQNVDKYAKTISISTSKQINSSSIPFNPDEETKEQKKLRKKLVKEDKKEKRKQKKELKTAFNSEKCKLMKQIADTNQVIRYGLSVKEI